MTSNSVKSDANRSKRKKETKNESPENPQLSSSENTDLPLSEGSYSNQKMEALETVLNDTSKEINALLSKYAHILSERAATDASYVEELEGIIKEACTIEQHLKLKRENVRHRFAVIAAPLQSEDGASGKS